MKFYRVEFIVGDPNDEELDKVLEKVEPSIPWEWRIQDFTVTEIEKESP